MRKQILAGLPLGLALVPAAMAADDGEPPAQAKEEVAARLLTVDPVPRLRSVDSLEKAERRRRSHRRPRRSSHTASAVASPQLQAIAQCESGGNPQAVGGGGLYRGKYQFTTGTWASVGGTGDPAAAPEAEQDRRAAMLLAREGAGHWPNCGA